MEGVTLVTERKDIPIAGVIIACKPERQKVRKSEKKIMLWTYAFISVFRTLLTCGLTDNFFSGSKTFFNFIVNRRYRF